MTARCVGFRVQTRCSLRESERIKQRSWGQLYLHLHKGLKALPAQRTLGTAGLGSPLQSQDAGGVELAGGGFYDHATRCCGEAFYKIKDKSIIHVVLEAEGLSKP